MKRFILLDVVLNLFDGAAAGGEGAGQAGAQGETQASPASTRRGGKTGEYTNVKFGRQGSQAAAQEPANASGQSAPDAGEKTKQGVITTSNTLEERRKAYRDMVNSEEFKDLYTEDTQRIINRRFKETQALQQQMGQYQPVIDMLMQRYKIGDGDVSKLMAAVEGDDAYWSQAAEEAGMSVEQYRQFQKLQRENRELLRQQQAQRGQQAAQQQMQKWAAEAEQAKQLYPDFDLNTELENPQFRYLISNAKSPVPLKLAYEVIHMDDIKAGVARAAAANTEKQVVGNIRAKGARPQENGTSFQSAFTVRDDVTKTSKKDRNEVARRVMRGEKIGFG